MFINFKYFTDINPVSLSKCTNNNEPIDDSEKAPSNDEVEKDTTETIPSS